jgi:hypothetical protein
MLAEIKEDIIDWYLTRKTGKSKKQREWEAWYEVNVNYRARDITDMFKNFTHIIEVNPDKFFNLHEPFGWVPCVEAKQYFWPQRELGDNCVWRMERVMWDKWDSRWRLNELGGGDHVFVATNSDDDAVMIALKYS